MNFYHGFFHPQHVLCVLRIPGFILNLENLENLENRPLRKKLGKAWNGQGNFLQFVSKSGSSSGKQVIWSAYDSH